MPQGKKETGQALDRCFLVVVDPTKEMHTALRFACYRARRTGGYVSLLYVLEPADFHHWATVGELMREEAREAAEESLTKLSSGVKTLTGKMPVLFVREGIRSEELLKIIEEESSISVLVLAASSDQDGPGPLINHLVNKMAGELRIPITIVPGNLTDDALRALT
ncbi:MAG: universal stress protein [Rhodospirillaceae bacterium]|nr:MAG: universal stress protein [Rhodospirillaceae bacterium]